MWSTSPPLIDCRRHGLNNAPDNTDFLRRYARRVLRDVREGDAVRALPILRRMIAQQVTPELRLSELYAIRASIRLKHFLHMLAHELGFSAWERCKSEVNDRPANSLDRYRMDSGMYADYQQNWFANRATADRWQSEHGGYLIQYGQQVVAHTELTIDSRMPAAI